MTKPTTFEITEDHMKLMRAADLEWQECESGAPGIDCKRPYGSSSVLSDIARILGWNYSTMTEDGEDRAWQLHRETMTVLEIALDTVKMGQYVYRNKRWCPR